MGFLVNCIMRSCAEGFEEEIVDRDLGERGLDSMRGCVWGWDD